jgi:hypothetical protein
MIYAWCVGLSHLISLRHVNGIRSTWSSSQACPPAPTPWPIPSLQPFWEWDAPHSTAFWIGHDWGLSTWFGYSTSEWARRGRRWWGLRRNSWLRNHYLCVQAVTWLPGDDLSALCSNEWTGVSSNTWWPIAEPWAPNFNVQDDSSLQQQASDTTQILQQTLVIWYKMGELACNTISLHDSSFEKSN